MWQKAMSNRLIFMKKNAFLLIELVFALGIMVLFLTYVARFQKNSWFLNTKISEKIMALRRFIDEKERG